MIYEKLPVVLLSTIASEKQFSTNKAIAGFVLAHRKDVADMRIKELAAHCHVGTGSISRFCKEIGLEDFAELKKLLSDSSLVFEQVQADDGDWPDQWNARVTHSISAVTRSVDLKKIETICRDIAAYDNIMAFGLLKAQSAAINLQVDLLMLGKQIDTCISYGEQMERILSATRDDLIIIFSYTSAYFDYPNLRGRLEDLRRPKIWMISSGTDPLPDFVDGHIWFASPHDQISHPYQLEAVESLLAQTYSMGIHSN